MAAALGLSASSPARQGQMLNRSSSHATIRLDGFLKEGLSHDLYRPADMPRQGEMLEGGQRFVRKMNTSGLIRPSATFLNRSRASRPANGGPKESTDMSQMPTNALDPRSDPRHLSLEYPLPSEIDDSFIKLYENHNLMTVSERQAEHQVMKQGEKEWRKAKAESAIYKKRMETMTNHFPNGVVGIEGPLFEGTRFYARDRHILEQMGERRGRHAEGRYDNLAYHRRVDDVTAGHHPPEEIRRSSDIPVQQKVIDIEQHPQRFLNTHDRLFPDAAAYWDPSRAKMIRSHDTRGRRHNFLSQADNELTYHKAVSAYVPQFKMNGISLKDVNLNRASSVPNM